jgi:hypothetical protein
MKNMMQQQFNKAIIGQDSKMTKQVCTRPQKMTNIPPVVSKCL